MAKKGKLIVIDGTDGSGKATQAKLLLKYLKKQGYRHKFIDFPRYYSSFHGNMVGRYLAGEFGGIDEINPYLASLTYALDRLTARDEMRQWLKEGNIVVANRYTSSNMAHQTVKLPKKEQKRFLDWLYQMEYKVHKLPKENVVIFLYVPVGIGQKLVDKKGKRGYVGGNKRDIAESDFNHLEEASKMYQQLARRYKHWVQINCLDKKGRLKSREEIHKMVIQVLRQRKIV